MPNERLMEVSTEMDVLEHIVSEFAGDGGSNTSLLHNDRRISVFQQTRREPPSLNVPFWPSAARGGTELPRQVRWLRP